MSHSISDTVLTYFCVQLYLLGSLHVPKFGSLKTFKIEWFEERFASSFDSCLALSLSLEVMNSHKATLLVISFNLHHQVVVSCSSSKNAENRAHLGTFSSWY